MCSNTVMPGYDATARKEYAGKSKSWQPYNTRFPLVSAPYEANYNALYNHIQSTQTRKTLSLLKPDQKHQDSITLHRSLYTETSFSPPNSISRQ